MSSTSLADQMYEVMKTRRAVRTFTDEPVADDLLWRVVRSARWASNASNRHVHKFLIIRDRDKIAIIRSFSPGMLNAPPAIIAILTDQEAVQREQLQPGDNANDIDIGTAAQNMMNIAHALGLGSCPVTSFSKSGVATAIALPPHLTPELLLMVGHPQAVPRQLGGAAPKPLSARDLTYWEDAGRHEP
ncbi:MAG: hypothetical protein QOF33_1018 [Thermomicrobiales bacterium]|jgi:nitroreductase|nr:hypothetical protein [Thermomicrobiales bacterium]